MKICHAAAFALVTWYLMVPSDRPQLSDPVEWTSHAPFRDWQIVQRFSAASSCEKRRLEIVSDAKHAINADAKDKHMDAVLSDYAIANNAICLSRDDPRLAK
jgi:hypothetical protein